MIYIYISAHFVNLVVSGLSQRKAVMIISEHWKAIANEILEKMGRGVTVIHGEGGYSGKPGKILYAVIPFQSLSRLKELIRRVDPNAFAVFSDTLEVLGKRIGNQPY